MIQLIKKIIKIFEQIYIYWFRENYTVLIKLDHSKNAHIPTKGTTSSAGLDLYTINDFTVKSKDFVVVPTGVYMCIPDGHFGKIECRSSLAIKGFSILGGVIDRDYTGEINVILLNNSEYDYNFYKEDRIAQIVIHKILNYPVLKIVNNLEITERNQNGFGSTGK